MSNVTHVTQERLKKLFTYDEGGFLLNKVRRSKRSKIGEIAGCINTPGYRKIEIEGRTYSASRLIWLYHNGYLPEFLDHINNNQANDKIQNLRPCTLSQNNFNRIINSNNKSGFKGVCWHKTARLWQANIKVNKKQKYLGLFWDKEVAAQVVMIERVNNHGEFYNHG